MYLWFLRGDEGVDVVPNFDWIFPREKVEEEVSFKGNFTSKVKDLNFPPKLTLKLQLLGYI